MFRTILTGPGSEDWSVIGPVKLFGMTSEREIFRGTIVEACKVARDANA